MYLPPVTPVQAHQIYALLHVTRAMVRLDRTYDFLYFSSAFLHLAVRLAFVACGLSAMLRNLANKLAERLLAFDLVGRCRGAAVSLFRGMFAELLQNVTDVVSGHRSAWLVRSFLFYLVRWNPTLIRSAGIYYVLYTFAFTLFWLPLSFYADFLLPHRYGLSHEPVLTWLSDSGKDTAVSAVGGALIVALALWGISLYPKRWPVILAAWAAPVILLGIFFDPVFDRIDNNFTPLPKSSVLYVPLHHLAASAGVPNATIYVVDKSKQTDETNAYVTGLGSSAQIVLWDTTINRMKSDEIVAIIGHELGHYVEHHVVIGGILTAGALFVYLPLLKAASEWILDKNFRRWRIGSLSDPAALPILFLVIGVLNFAASPIINAVSRAIEHRADSYGLALTRNRLAMGRAMVDLANQNMENPYPPKWEVFWLDDHPPAGERIHFALYGQPMRIRR